MAKDEHEPCNQDVHSVKPARCIVLIYSPVMFSG